MDCEDYSQLLREAGPPDRIATHQWRRGDTDVDSRNEVTAREWAEARP